jgi:hypothetical protein
MSHFYDDLSQYQFEKLDVSQFQHLDKNVSIDSLDSLSINNIENQNRYHDYSKVKKVIKKAKYYVCVMSTVLIYGRWLVGV